MAFSGGVDSALLAVAAHKVLGDAMVAATADSASLGSGELDACRRLTDAWGIPWVAVTTDELDDERYLANDTDRCYWCKTALMDQLVPVASRAPAPPWRWGSTSTTSATIDRASRRRPSGGHASPSSRPG